jgi:hypothetical protein
MPGVDLNFKLSKTNTTARNMTPPNQLSTRRTSTNSGSAAMTTALARAIAKQAAQQATQYFKSTNAPTPAPTRAKRATTGPKQTKQAGVLPMAVANVASSKGTRGTEPRFISRDARATRIVHRELIGSVKGSVLFTVANSLPINPGMPQTFPWLATQAASWEQYRFNRLRFCYYSRCSTTVPGSVLLCPDYDASDPPPGSELIACAYRDVVEEVPWNVEFSCSLDPKGMLGLAPRKYVRVGPLDQNLDIKTYDSGTLHLCTVDGTAVNWGKLWVEYDVELFIPQLPSLGSSLVVSQHVTATVPTTFFNLTGSGILTNNFNPGQIVTASGNTFTFAVTGLYFFSMVVSATNITNSPDVFTGGAALDLSFNNDTGGVTNGSGTAVLIKNLVIKVPLVGATFTTNLNITSGVYVDWTFTSLMTSYV